MYYNSWNNLFNEQHTEKIVDRILPSFKSAILNKKGIFCEKDDYEVVKNKIEQMAKLFEAGMNTSEKIRRNNSKQSKDFNEFDEADKVRIRYTSKSLALDD